MCTFLQNEKWWYEFTIRGKRFRKSARTSDRELAKLIEAEHRRSLELGTGGISPTLQAIRSKEKEYPQVPLAIPSPNSQADEQRPKHKRTYPAKAGPMPGMSLREAGELWLNKQRELRGPKTIEANEAYLKNLLKFFGDIRLSEFHIGHFEHYQGERGKHVGSSSINHELNMLSRILNEVDLWHPIKRRYNPLKEKEWKPPKIFTVEEQGRLFKKLKENPNLELSDIVFTITRNTTASGSELRGLRLCNVELEADPPRVHIPRESTKNNIRPRTIPLNAEALAAFRRALDRAKKLGCHYPENYLFPFRINRAEYDPTRPASKSWLRKQTKHLRELTGIEHTNPHTFRHLAVTELLEKGAPEETVIALAGWVGRNMIKTYSHTRIEAKADVVGLLDGSGHPKVQEPVQSGGQPPGPDMMHPAIQAEIARQVALALQQLNPAPPKTPPAPQSVRPYATSSLATHRRLRKLSTYRKRWI